MFCERCSPFWMLVVLLLAVPGTGARADETALLAAVPVGQYDWPSIDSIRVDHGYYNAEIDTCRITVYLTNPIANHTFNWDLFLRLYRDLVGYDYSFPSQPVTLAPGQTEIELIWYDPEAPDGFEYDLEAWLQDPESRGNLVTNGNFSSGLSGWTLHNNNPPGYGVEVTTLGESDPDNEAHVYSTQYNTYGIQPEMVQRVNLSPSSESVVHLRFKMHTDDIMWGYGIARIYIRTDRGGEYTFWHSTVAPPPNSSTHHYWPIMDSNWHERKIYLRDLPQGVDQWIEIGARAELQCGMPYCMAETDIYLDDIGAYDSDDPTLDEYLAGFVKTDMSTQYIGDYTVALRECVSETFPDMGLIEDAIPLLQTVHVWDRFHTDICAAAVYQQIGNDTARDVAASMAAYRLFEPVLTYLSLAHAAVKASVLDVVGHGIMHALRNSVLERLEDQLLGRGLDFPQVAADVSAGLRDPDGDWRPGVDCLFLGPLDVSLSVLDGGGQVRGSCTAETLGVTRCVVIPLLGDSLLLASLDEGARVLTELDSVCATDSLCLSAVARSDGYVSLHLMHRQPPDPTIVQIYNLPLQAGDRLMVNLIGPGGMQSSYAFRLDRGGDGSIDSVITRGAASGLGEEEQDSPAAPWLAVAAPVDPSGRVTIRFGIPMRMRGTDVELAILDVGGRVVRTLRPAPRHRGASTIVWDGLDSNGCPVASGVYLCRLAWGGNHLVTRTVLIR
ncbi:MAG: hypothetical protein KAY32_15935 [Candidatus Eisenbacteria sp.]|nr:hypothetical protein [Candidatus Eisenbacteria bacterium]